MISRDSFTLCKCPCCDDKSSATKTLDYHSNVCRLLIHALSTPPWYWSTAFKICDLIREIKDDCWQQLLWKLILSDRHWRVWQIDLHQADEDHKLRVRGLDAGGKRTVQVPRESQCRTLPIVIKRLKWTRILSFWDSEWNVPVSICLWISPISYVVYTEGLI